MSRRAVSADFEEFRDKIHRAMDELLKNNGIELLGNWTVDIAELDTVALVKRNKIYLNITARRYPKHVLKYIIAHELAHLAVKSHSQRFWEIVRRIYPSFERGRGSLKDRLDLAKETIVS